MAIPGAQQKSKVAHVNRHNAASNSRNNRAWLDVLGSRPSQKKDVVVSKSQNGDTLSVVIDDSKAKNVEQVVDLKQEGKELVLRVYEAGGWGRYYGELIETVKFNPEEVKNVKIDVGRSNGKSYLDVFYPANLWQWLKSWNPWAAKTQIGTSIDVTNASAGKPQPGDVVVNTDFTDFVGGAKVTKHLNTLAASK